MKNPIHGYVCAMLMVVCVLPGLDGCAASTTPPATSTTSTTSAEAPRSVGQGEPLPATHPTTKGSEIVAPAQVAGPALTDGQIVAIASHINQAAITAANVALARGSSDAVRQLALIVRSGNDAADTKLLHAARAQDIVPADSLIGNRLHDDDDATKSALVHLSGRDLDRAYVDAQVGECQAALQLLDDQLIPSASDHDVRAALESMHAKLTSHLHEARKVQLSIGGM